MRSIREIVIIVVLVVLAALFGLIFGSLISWLLVATLIWIAIQVRQYLRVAQWAQRPWRKPKNGLDSWFKLSYAPYRALTRERTRTRQATARLRQILNLTELIPDGVIVLSGTGEIQGLNKAATEILQIRDADVGLVLSTVLRQPDFVEFLALTPDAEEPQILEFSSPLDAERSLEARRVVIEGGGQIVLIRDITTLNRLLTVRQNFVANVSHELRTPLAVLQGYLETIQDSNEEPEVRLQLTHHLSKPTQRMKSLVDDLLLLTRLETTESQFAAVPVDMGQLIKAVIAEMGSLNDCHNRVIFECDNSLKVSGVEAELHSLCTNLLSNALRYSEIEKPIHINCHQDGDKIELQVIDQGVGIADEHLSHLTERFYRVDMADARSRGGTGLGLAIVKHVLRRHNSSLQITTKLGHGSTFACRFQAYEPTNHNSTRPTHLGA